MEYYKVKLYKRSNPNQNKAALISVIDDIIVAKRFSLPTIDEIKTDTFKVKEIMTNLVINVFPESYCFEEANTNNRKLKPSYISKSDTNMASNYLY